MRDGERSGTVVVRGKRPNKEDICDNEFRPHESSAPIDGERSFDQPRVEEKGDSSLSQDLGNRPATGDTGIERSQGTRRRRCIRGASLDNRSATGEMGIEVVSYTVPSTVFHESRLPTEVAPDWTTGIGRPKRTREAGEKDQRGAYLYMELRTKLEGIGVTRQEESEHTRGQTGCTRVGRD